jgi:hypothetical protein
MGAQTCFQAAASQTAGQSVYHPAIVCVHLRTWRPPAAALLCVPKITDTEEVTGSNPVSPTSNTPSQRCFSGRLALGSADLSARFVGLSRRHHFAFRFMLDHRVPGSCLTLSDAIPVPAPRIAIISRSCQSGTTRFALGSPLLSSRSRSRTSRRGRLPSALARATPSPATRSRHRRLRSTIHAIGASLNAMPITSAGSAARASGRIEPVGGSCLPSSPVSHIGVGSAVCP